MSVSPPSAAPTLDTGLASGDPDERGDASFTITDLAREFDITPRAIRFYEDQGLLSPDRQGPGGRRRVYSARERTRLKLTLRGKRLGLSLGEIKEILDLYESPRDTVPQLERFLASLAQHRAVLTQQLEDLNAQLAEIDQHEAQCRQLLDEARGGGAKAPKRRKAA
ncbi:MerR family DNA-binding transcriptional regulator [Ralstonia solanacearum]|uniref:MerR family transcriptional regulator n=1 Tax=Ralstonia solanacearum K60 TaxID=1091042 RepID=A0AAP7ZLZ8_RALSL|nr:MerR family DNA-binding transcriptional regulator [Ralstonia solanacearum]MBT1536934.1 MerR family DNA-binding transcriptional regulator [Ralstonia solanacearum]OYQ13075.1 MerR family transcriptional regulator [Ralstonia solanacearum K60]QOK83429.1 MerR family DNA-binding transcriptional regulator [Ralstonia solanacearum]RIJ87128.1 MerR family DNA-binding transcriptional regulator [Ralstonia solanacearum]CCF97450.1 putative transcriptional regulator, MerR family [Ralstonia solanacearum K60]